MVRVMKTENKRDCMSIKLCPKCQNVNVLKRPVMMWSMNLPYCMCLSATKYYSSDWVRSGVQSYIPGSSSMQ